MQIAVSLTSVLVAVLAAAQSDGDARPAATISVNVKVVNVLASVRDKHGAIVNDLSRDDFILAEDGRPQDIRYFSKETDLPLTLGVLVDTSLSQRRVLDEERSASSSFVMRVLRENTDKAFIIHFDREVELLQDLTSSHEKLQSALQDLRTPRLEPASGPSGRNGGNMPGGGGGWPGGGGRGGSRGGGHHPGFGGPGTLLYDSVYLAGDELMSQQQGRKALIILSDGVDTGSKETLEYAIETAQRSDTIVYSILFKDDEAYDSGRGGFGGGWGGGNMGRRGGGYPREQLPDGKKTLERISRETGGRMFEVSKKHPIAEIYSEIEQELRNQYNLGYTPNRGTAGASGYHKIRLVAKKKDLVVQARDGYYGEQ
jgi:VWFA-related protein